MVEYHPISAKDQSRLRQFGAKVLPGIFLGCALYAGGIWKGDSLVADKEELEEMDASELQGRRLNAKEVLTPQRSGNFKFPIAVSHAHFSETFSLRGVQISRTRMAQGVCSGHPPSVLFPHGHLDTSCRTVPDPKARVKRTSA